MWGKLIKYLTLVTLVFLQGCGSLFYFPTEVLYVDVKKLEIEPQQIELKTSKNENFFGWYFKASEKPKAKILFFHGNAQNRTSHFYALYWILKNNYDFFVFDYPGYGESEGSPSQEATTDAGSKALDWLAVQDPKIPIIIFGQSLGGNIALYTAAKSHNVNICLVAVDSTFRSYRKVAQRVIARSWFLWPFQGLSYVLVRDSFSAENLIQKISPTPLIVFHGESDPVVDLQNGRDVFDEAKDPKNFYLVPGHGHTTAFNGPNQATFRKYLLDEIQKHCSSQKFF